MISFQQKLQSILILTAIVSTGTACGNTQNVSPQSANSNSQYRTAASSYIEKSAITDQTGKTWVPLEPAIASLGYRIKDESSNGGYAKIGYSDVMYMMRPSSRKVYSLGQQFYLPEAPQRRNGHIYLTTTSLSKFLQTKVSINSNNGEVMIDTPTEPINNNQVQSFRIQSRTSVNTDELVSYAKRYMGVPYVFGAGPYEDTKTFDCSSFTRHVYRKFGVNLPRLAKDQDNQGRRVNRNELRQGDLIFFTVPGRFKSNAIPGHVGIYIGNGKFIHTWGEPGVQISNLDNGYWSDVILHMQRIH
ncbi:C40 family peptidase [Paenibacillus wynnii]|uniref:Cell wall hydrolase n=1 Tax=Paenibacillus wynnii TaxID=268407 RepID=A0A098M2T5_9BACL|nr:C40 family peptidase [Paenibacillus wynnii]KGE16730.1 cell wall hydrolase [Paenibacillus wynnii]